MAIDKIIHLTRHAQAEHNVGQDYSIPDPPLTELGFTQACELARITWDTIQVQADLLVTSPLTRTLQTTLLGYSHLKDRLESQSDRKSVIALPELQEVNAHPCDIGRDRWELEKVPDFKDVDFTSLGDDWNSKQDIFAPENVLQRARCVRKWLRSRPEKNIVVVSHAGFLLALTGGGIEQEWANAEVRQYTLKSDDDDDDDAYLVFARKEEQTGGAAPRDTGDVLEP